MFTLKATATTVHIAGINTQTGYAMSTCPALSRIGARFWDIASYDSLSDALSAASKSSYKVCTKCARAAQAVLSA